jgi:hypothetical protein
MTSLTRGAPRTAYDSVDDRAVFRVQSIGDDAAFVQALTELAGS